jgi:hypothetical protein
MKSFLTTLDLVMQDKVEPETVVEEDEIEETLTINEDGEIVDENWLTDKIKSGVGKWKKAKRIKQDDPTHWSGGKARQDNKDDYKPGGELHPDTLMGGEYDESVEQIEKYVLECERLHEMQRLSGQVITEAPMSREHYVTVADIIASISNPTVRHAIMTKFSDELGSKYSNFQPETFVSYVRNQGGHVDARIGAQQDEPEDEMPEEPEDHPDGELVHINGKVLPERIPHDKLDAWLAANPGSGIAESA